MKLILLTGHRKGGTSVFHKLFDGHPYINIFPVDISVLYAYFPYFTSKYYKDPDFLLGRIKLILSRTLNPMEGRKVANGTSLFEFETYWGNLAEILDIRQLCERDHVIKSVLEAYGKTHGMDPELPWVVKETSQAIHTGYFLEKFPDIRILNVVRDPRDNYAALKSGVDKYYSKIGENDLETLASLLNRWRVDTLAARNWDAGRPDAFRTIRFEDIALKTRETMESIAEFCGITMDDSLLTPTFLEESYTGNSHEGIAFRGISSENIGRWRERISEQEAQVIEFWLEDFMTHFRYDPCYNRNISANAFADFYSWYNTRYFYKDSFSND